MSPRSVTGTEARAPVPPARAAVTTCRRPFDGRQGRASRGSGGWRSTAREPAGRASGERPAAVSLGSRAVGSERRFLRVLPLTRCQSSWDPPSRPHLTLVTAPRPHPLMPATGNQGSNPGTWGDTRSGHDTRRLPSGDRAQPRTRDRGRRPRSGPLQRLAAPCSGTTRPVPAPRRRPPPSWSDGPQTPNLPQALRMHAAGPPAGLPPPPPVLRAHAWDCTCHPTKHSAPPSKTLLISGVLGVFWGVQ